MVITLWRYGCSFIVLIYMRRIIHSMCFHMNIMAVQQQKNSDIRAFISTTACEELIRFACGCGMRCDFCRSPCALWQPLPELNSMWIHQLLSLLSGHFLFAPRFLDAFPNVRGTTTYALSHAHIPNCTTFRAAIPFVTHIALFGNINGNNRAKCAHTAWNSDKNMAEVFIKHIQELNLCHLLSSPRFFPHLRRSTQAIDANAECTLRCMAFGRVFSLLDSWQFFSRLGFIIVPRNIFMLQFPIHICSVSVVQRSLSLPIDYRVRAASAYSSAGSFCHRMLRIRRVAFCRDPRHTLSYCPNRFIWDWCLFTFI